MITDGVTLAQSLECQGPNTNFTSHLRKLILDDLRIERGSLNFQRTNVLDLVASSSEFADYNQLNTLHLSKHVEPTVATKNGNTRKALSKASVPLVFWSDSGPLSHSAS